jgi:hypothetical protein
MTTQAKEPSPSCRRAVVDGEVTAGARFWRPIGNRLAVELEPLPSGWILRVVPASGAYGDHDYAELATPPYESVSPLLVSTDFSFRAQDAIAWNPRRFRFAADPGAYAKLRVAYQRLRGPSPHAFGQPFQGSAAAEQELAAAIGGASDGMLQILDARLEAGTADQSRAAAAVAVHFDSTGHVSEQPVNGRATGLGKILWMRFRIELRLPRGFQPERDLPLKTQACPDF